MEKGSVWPSETLEKTLDAPSTGLVFLINSELMSQAQVARLVVRKARLAMRNCHSLFVVESPPTGCENMLGPKRTPSLPASFFEFRDQYLCVFGISGRTRKSCEHRQQRLYRRSQGSNKIMGKITFAGSRLLRHSTGSGRPRIPLPLLFQREGQLHPEEIFWDLLNNALWDVS